MAIEITEVAELPKSKRKSGVSIEFVAAVKAHLIANPGKLYCVGKFSGPTAQQRKMKLVEKSGLGDNLEVSTRTVDEVGEDGKKLVGVFARLRATESVVSVMKAVPTEPTVTPPMTTTKTTKAKA